MEVMIKDMNDPTSARTYGGLEDDATVQRIDMEQLAHDEDNVDNGKVEMLEDVNDGMQKPSECGNRTFQLNKAQQRAVDIFIDHVDQLLQGLKPAPLRTIVFGEGGAGKSAIHSSIREALEERRVPHWLMSCAPTGMAASLIDGKTAHSIGGFSGFNSAASFNEPLPDETRKRLGPVWKDVRILVIDEMSMIPKDFLATLSRNISSVRPESPYSFGGISVLMMGDFMQFAPVGKKKHHPLYHPCNPQTDDAITERGRKIYEEFTTVIELTEQHRVKDSVWHEVLTSMRNGTVEQRHIDILKGLVLGNDPADDIDWYDAPWNDAVLVTSRNVVRDTWNELMLRKKCAIDKKTVYVCPAQDTCRGAPAKMYEKCALLAGKKKKKDLLPHELELAIGCKVLITNNVETDLDLTNGARGEVADIILNSDEPPFDPLAPIVRLKYAPLCVLVKVARTKADQLDGLDAGVIPIELAEKNYTIKIRNSESGTETTRSIKRRQLPLVLAYAFTDYKAQGQTLPYSLVDIATPPHGRINLFNLYVALSRSVGRDTIRILRDFDSSLLKTKHDKILMDELDRLRSLSAATEQWYETVFKEQRGYNYM